MDLRFDPSQGLIIIPTRISGPHGNTVVHLALDTGATGSLVGWDILTLLGYDPAAVPERIQMTTGSSLEFVPQVTVEKIEALGIERLSFPVICHNLPPSATVAGVLGLDFLREQKLVIDLRSGILSID